MRCVVAFGAPVVNGCIAWVDYGLTTGDGGSGLQVEIGDWGVFAEFFGLGEGHGGESRSWVAFFDGWAGVEVGED